MSSDKKNIAQTIAKYLLEIEAVNFRFEPPFQWSSGWKSPVYCDSRLSISYPEIRNYITEAFVALIKEHYPEAQNIAGVATAGIAQAALVAEALSLPMSYVRPKPKDHGMENLIEGKVEAKQKVVLIEDIFSTGGSSLKAVEALRKAGCEVLGIVAIFTYGFDSMNHKFEEAGIHFCTLSDYTTLLAEYAKTHDISDEVMASLHDWRRSPETWRAVE